MSDLEPEALLRRLAHEFHRRKQENKEKAGPESQQRRRHVKELNGLEAAFTTLLNHWVKDAQQREAWHDHFYHFGPTPSGPELEHPPLFRGHAPGERWAEIRKAPNAAYELIIDGKPVRRTSESPTLSEHRIKHVHYDGQAFEENFTAPDEAQAALADYYANPRDGAPWEHAPALYNDGLIDANFGLTRRGQRWLDRLRNGDGGVDIWL